MNDRKDLSQLLDTLTSKQMIMALGLLVATAIAIIGATYFAYFSQFHDDYSQKQEVWGQFGDFIGGTINPILTFLSFMALVFTVIIQTRQLEHSREELRRTIEAQKESTAVSQAQTKYANTSTRLSALQASLAVTSELLSQAQAAGTLAGPAGYAAQLLNRKKEIAGEILRITDELINEQA